MTRDETRRAGSPKRSKKVRDPKPSAERSDTKAPTPVEGRRLPQRQRIAKLMARVGLCSRRDAESWILEGRVNLNGIILKSPATDVGPDDVILVDDAPLPQAEKTRLFLFHKPRGLVTSDHDPEGRPTVADFLRENWPDGPRTVTVGRLDINTEGLLLLTNDGGLARVLELPQTGWVRRYRVRAKGETDQAKLDALAHGVSIDGIDYVGIDAKLDRIQGANCWLTMGLREGKNREVKRVLEHVGLEVNRLIRLSFGPFQLLDLPEGAVEEVRTRVLRDQLGDTLAAAAGVDLGDEGAAPETRSERPARATRPAPNERPARRMQGVDGAPRRGERYDRPPRAPDEVTPPRLGRPQTGTRKHVSALRADARHLSKTGPRKQIERSETADHKARTVVVERLVKAGGAAERPREARTERPPGRGRASPSALGKRERMAKSGGRETHPRDPRGGRDRDAAHPKSRPRQPDSGDHFDREDRRHASKQPTGPKRFEAKRPNVEARRGPDRHESDRGAPRSRSDERNAGGAKSALRRPSGRSERSEERKAPVSNGPKRFGAKRADSPREVRASDRKPSGVRPDRGDPKRGPKGPRDDPRPPGKRPPGRGTRGPSKPKR